MPACTLCNLVALCFLFYGLIVGNIPLGNFSVCILQFLCLFPSFLSVYFLLDTNNYCCCPECKNDRRLCILLLLDILCTSGNLKNFHLLCYSEDSHMNSYKHLIDPFCCLLLTMWDRVCSCNWMLILKQSRQVSSILKNGNSAFQRIEILIVRSSNLKYLNRSQRSNFCSLLILKTQS